MRARASQSPGERAASGSASNLPRFNVDDEPIGRNPLTRRAPAEESAGCGPPSPPKGERVIVKGWTGQGASFIRSPRHIFPISNETPTEEPEAGKSHVRFRMEPRRPRWNMSGSAHLTATAWQKPAELQYSKRVTNYGQVEGPGGGEVR